MWEGAKHTPAWLTFCVNLFFACARSDASRITWRIFPSHRQPSAMHWACLRSTSIACFRNYDGEASLPPLGHKCMLWTGPASLMQEISTRPTCIKGTPQISGDGSSPMARFYFDSGDRDLFFEDEIGVECAGLDEVRRAGFEGLVDLTRESLKSVDGEQLFVEVRNENGDRILRLSLSLQVKLMK